ncbi:hypothetical protein ACIGB6_02550 [Paeniglutamicibacter gangotriensis]|uniref:Uncharacterized protein n=1 Tax=Paeniglutamicibacter gangotriensis Lz1y TaxID=1276920 RepID=M7MLC0_9MICC|nr:hypothetical protein [Paeniglutamicibacter gangotriensis]EMQ97132.1 hypothetical protein ADIAG_03654 [Paeniglutamicibacter gangotriensis Lz1y]
MHRRGAPWGGGDESVDKYFVRWALADTCGFSGAPVVALDWYPYDVDPAITGESLEERSLRPRARETK